MCLLEKVENNSKISYIRKGGKTESGSDKRFKKTETSQPTAWDWSLKPTKEQWVEFMTRTGEYKDLPNRPNELRTPLADIIGETTSKDYINQALKEAEAEVTSGKEIPKDNIFSNLTKDQLAELSKDNYIENVASIILRSPDYIYSKSGKVGEKFAALKRNIDKVLPHDQGIINRENILEHIDRFKRNDWDKAVEFLKAADDGRLLEWVKENPKSKQYVEPIILRNIYDQAFEGAESIANKKTGINKLPDVINHPTLGKVNISNIKQQVINEGALSGVRIVDGKKSYYNYDVPRIEKYIEQAINLAPYFPKEFTKIGQESALQSLGLSTRGSGKGVRTATEKIINLEETRQKLRDTNKKLEQSKPKGYKDKIQSNLNKIEKINKELEAGGLSKLSFDERTFDEIGNNEIINTQTERVLEALGKKPIEAWEGILERVDDLASDVQVKKAMEKASAENLTDAQREEIISEKINPKNNAVRQDLYDTALKAEEQFIKDAKTEKELKERIKFLLQKATNTTNAVQSLARMGVKIGGYRSVKGESVKAKDLKNEHLKVSVDQAFKSTNAAIEGKWTGEGRDIMSDFEAVFQLEKKLDILDDIGERTNTSNLSRMVLDIAESKNIKLVDKNGEVTTYYDKLINEVAKELNLTTKEIDLLKKEFLADAVAMSVVDPVAGKKMLETLFEKDLVKEREKVYNENQKQQVFSKSRKPSISNQAESMARADKALELGRERDKEIKKARIFDFDDTVARTNSKVFATKDGKKKILTAEEFAKQGEKLENDGWKMDFSDFNKVVDGKKGPLFDVMKKMKEAAGDRDMFILTARSQESAKPIQRFLKEMGIDIPLDHITGLGNSTGAAKGQWVLDKASEGYNDFYFADDATQNVRAVKEILDQLDVKSKVQQAFSSSKDISKEFNKLVQASSGVEWYKEFSPSKAAVLGESKGKGKFILPSGAEDYLGLVYTTLGKGKIGENQLKWYEKNIINPYQRGERSLATERINMMADFKALKKELNVPKDLRDKTESGFTKEQAVRTYLWEKSGFDIPGLSKTDLAELKSIVEKDPKLKAFADQIQLLTKGDKYSTPKEHWLAGTITTDLIDILNTTKRDKYLKEFKDNIDLIYSKENLNKLEAIYGKKYRNALENSIKRMKSGSNRTGTESKLTNDLLDYINGSVGTIMFFNTRSALLQTISAANFINLGFNNPVRAGKAFANQPQYWKDFNKLMNSDYLVDRRNGLKLNISESEIANAAASSKNKAKAVMGYILEKGYLPTKFADSFAIASGGATWYRNKIIDLMKNDPSMKKIEAERIAYEEFVNISEKSQQSSNPSKISAQQASTAGRIFLQFVNTPMQYTRLQKRAVQDLVNGRGNWKEHVSKILYYGIMQNLWFNAMQQGAFAIGFGDGEIGEKEEEKIFNTANGMLDSILRGSGFAGMTTSVLKNTIIDLYERSNKPRPEYQDAWQSLLQFSPAIRSKFMKLKQAGWAFDSKKRRQDMIDKGFSLDNPAYEAGAKIISATTNLPLDRLFTKGENISHAFANDTETWERIANLGGWPSWQLQTSKSQNQEIYDDPSSYTSWEQKSILKQYGLSDRGIKLLKNKEERINKIIKLQKEKNKQYFPKEQHKSLYYKPRTK